MSAAGAAMVFTGRRHFRHLTLLVPAQVACVDPVNTGEAEMNGAASGTSRRGFLGRAAGAAVAVAGAGVGAGAIARSAAAADQRSFTAGHFALDIDGVSCGVVAGVDGG